MTESLRGRYPSLRPVTVETEVSRLRAEIAELQAENLTLKAACFDLAAELGMLDPQPGDKEEA